MHMNNQQKMNSRIKFEDFLRKVNTTMNLSVCTIRATIIYKTDDTTNTFTKISVTLKSEPAGAGIVNLENFDTEKYYTEFNTDFQKFTIQRNALRINGNGKGEKSFTKYKVLILPE